MIAAFVRKLLKRAYSPPFSRVFKRGGCASIRRSRSLAAPDGVVSNFKQNKVRCASIHKGGYATFLLTTINASPYRARASRPPSASNGLMPRAPLLRNCASNSFIFSTRKTGAVSFCFWSGRRTVGILLENAAGEWGCNHT
jgi:hypothetical protein